MEIKFVDYLYKEELLNFTIKEKEINGIIGKDYENFLNIIKLKIEYEGKIIINNIEINKAEINLYRRKISYVDEYFNATNINNIYDIIDNEIRKKKLTPKNTEKKIFDSLKIVGLNEEILNRSIYEISSSERKLLQIAISLLNNPDIIILNNPFSNLDTKNIKKVILLFQKLKDQYNKTIVIASNNSEIIYKYTNHLIIFKNNKVLIEGKTNEIFQRVDFLKKNGIEIPEIVEITYLAKKNKKVKIDYHNDIRDIIKDIYKHV